MNMDRVIVSLREGIVPSVFDFLRDDETDEQAEERAFFKSMDNIRTYAHHHECFPRIMPDGTEYWLNQLEVEDKTEYKVMSWDEFEQAQKTAILSMPLREITAEEWEEMLNVLPPKAWVTYNGVEMFCMSEFYTGSFTTQYAYDHRSGKYYSKLVDYCDRKTWIDELI